MKKIIMQNMKTAMFVDTRLHIAVRPVLEYQLPETAAMVKACLLGDARREDGVAALHSLLGGCAEHKEAIDDDNAVATDLQSACAHVCTHAHEHLQSIAAAWRVELSAVRDGVRRATREVSIQHSQALEMRARLRDKVPRIVDEDYRRETARLRALLDNRLCALRDRLPPPCKRPDALVRATHQLKEQFANAYGDMPTSYLMRVKTHFETELTCIGHATAKDFVRHAATLLN